MRPKPLIAVTDVEASSRWYQRLLGCQSAHGGTEYERLVLKGRLGRIPISTRRTDRWMTSATLISVGITS